MHLTVILDHLLQRTPDGAVWTTTTCARSFWERYLAVFDSVRAVVRIADVAVPPPAARRADGPGISFTAVPAYSGMLGYLRRRSAVRGVARQAVDDDSALILRIPSPLAGCAAGRIRQLARPYGAEVVGDPWDTFAPGAVPHPLRPLLRRHFMAQQRAQCAAACAAAYVTDQALQRRYPVGPGPAGGPTPATFAISSIELDEQGFVSGPRRPAPSAGPFTLILIGSLTQLYKAPDVLVEAMARLVAEGLDLRLVLVGEGRYRTAIAAQVERLDLGGRVEFRGQLPPGAAVRGELDRADLFVLPSRQEGLPRAMIEAMARGLPCIGSTVGGIPELLAAEDLVPPDDAVALAARIAALLRDPAHQARASTRNLARARDFHDDVLSARRRLFYQRVAERTAAWLTMGRR